MSDHNRAVKAQEPPRCDATLSGHQCGLDADHAGEHVLPPMPPSCTECGGTGTLHNGTTPVECDVCEGHGVGLPDPPAPSEPLPVVATEYRYGRGAVLFKQGDSTFVDSDNPAREPLTYHDEASRRITEAEERARAAAVRVAMEAAQFGVQLRDATERAEKAEERATEAEDEIATLNLCCDGYVNAIDKLDSELAAAAERAEKAEAECAKLRAELDAIQRETSK